jgi:hypothetical protein
MGSNGAKGQRPPPLSRRGFGASCDRRWLSGGDPLWRHARPCRAAAGALRSLSTGRQRHEGATTSENKASGSSPPGPRLLPRCRCAPSSSPRLVGIPICLSGRGLPTRLQSSVFEIAFSGSNSLPRHMREVRGALRGGPTGPVWACVCVCGGLRPGRQARPAGSRVLAVNCRPRCKRAKGQNSKVRPREPRASPARAPRGAPREPRAEPRASPARAPREPRASLARTPREPRASGAQSPASC